MNHLKRGLAVAAVTALPLSLAALPANAAGLGESCPATGVPGGVTKTTTLTDEGGVDFKVTLKFGYCYTDNAANTRAQAGPLTITPDPAKSDDDTQIDFRVRVYSARPDGTLVKIQDRYVDGADLGADLSVSVNPKNPIYYPGGSRIKVSNVGIDNDGLKGSGAHSFLVPELSKKGATT